LPAEIFFKALLPLFAQNELFGKALQFGATEIEANADGTILF
jgi:hypothetical protein